MSAPGTTPGPWAASIEKRPEPSRGHWYVVMDAEENGLGEFYGEDHEANVANARIAAAAPDLFEALERCRARLLVVGQIGTKDEVALNMALAALNKAQGIPNHFHQGTERGLKSGSASLSPNHDGEGA